jgi:hypothetical protein
MTRYNLSSAFSPALRRLFQDVPNRRARRQPGRKASSTRPADSSRRVRPCLEALEDRITPTTFTPTTFADDGTANSLRGAITQANGDAGTAVDIVQLQTGTYQLTLANTAGKHEQGNTQGDLNITSTRHALVIQGTTDAKGHPTTTIQQAALDRVFQVVNPGTSVTFKDVVIEGGQAQDDGSAGAAAGSTTALGGGILDDGGDVTLTNVVLQKNSAHGGAGFDADGGGIFAERAGSLTIQSSVVQANSAFAGANNNNGGLGGFGKGGGAFAGCPTTITASILSGNTVTGGAGDTFIGGSAEGGGIFTQGATTITDSTLSDNTLQGGSSNAGIGGNAIGGGVFANGPTTITASTLSGNTLIGSKGNLSSFIIGGHVGGDAEGGGLFVDTGTATISTSTLSGNILTGGNGSINNSDANIRGNVGGHAQGGSVYAGSSSKVTIRSSTLSGNRLTGGNGNFVSGTVEGSIGGSASGGGVYANDATTTITASTLSGNTVNGGSARGGSATPGTAQGGASFAGDTGYELVNSTVADNQAIGGVSDSVGSAAFGGGLFFGNNTTATLTNVTVAGNKASLPQNGPDYAGVAGTGSGHNLIGDASGSAGFNVATQGDLLGTTSNPLNPHLGPLQNNGGPTPTLALLPGSPALDAGFNSAQSVTGPLDQRGQGFARAVNGTVDIGAFEVQPPSPSGGSSPTPKPPPASHKPFLLALFDALLKGIETVNSNETETVTDSFFGIPLLVSTYDGSGNLTSVTLFGINVTFLFELPL